MRAPVNPVLADDERLLEVCFLTNEDRQTLKSQAQRLIELDGDGALCRYLLDRCFDACLSAKQNPWPAYLARLTHTNEALASQPEMVDKLLARIKSEDAMARYLHLCAPIKEAVINSDQVMTHPHDPNHEAPSISLRTDIIGNGVFKDDQAHKLHRLTSSFDDTLHFYLVPSVL